MPSTQIHHHHPNLHPPNYKKPGPFDVVLRPLRRWLDNFPVKNDRFAHIVCQVIPCCCPFERDVNLFGRTIHIPALCKFNPLYDEFVGLRFRALSYLADECGVDVTKYIC